MLLSSHSTLSLLESLMLLSSKIEQSIHSAQPGSLLQNLQLTIPICLKTTCILVFVMPHLPVFLLFPLKICIQFHSLIFFPSSYQFLSVRAILNLDLALYSDYMDSNLSCSTERLQITSIC